MNDHNKRTHELKQAILLLVMEVVSLVCKSQEVNGIKCDQSCHSDNATRICVSFSLTHFLNCIPSESVTPHFNHVSDLAFRRFFAFQPRPLPLRPDLVIYCLFPSLRRSAMSSSTRKRSLTAESPEATHKQARTSQTCGPCRARVSRCDKCVCQIRPPAFLGLTNINLQATPVQFMHPGEHTGPMLPRSSVVPTTSVSQYDEGETRFKVT